MRVSEIFSRVLKRVKPAKPEVAEERAFARKIIKRLHEAIPHDIGVELVGSIAKDTHLKGDRDVDIFLLFPKGTSREDLVKKGLDYAKKALKPGEKWQVGYAEHPYLKAEIEGYEVELVPCYKIREIMDKASSADRSPLHCRYVLEFLTEAECDEVRLLKAFLKRHGVYGAEVRTEGFSGYLCELLIIEFRKFETLLREAAAWGGVPVLDPENHHADKEALRAKFPLASMIAIDPVDPDRNVAAAVSADSLARFMLAARAFIKNPSEEHFIMKKEEVGAAGLERLRKKFEARGTRLIALEFKAPEVIEDVLWPQLRKAANNFATRLEEKGFRLFDSGYWSDEKICLMLFEFEVAELPAIQKVLGPDVKHAKACEDFANAHKKALAGPWVEGGRMAAAEPREWRRAVDLVEEITGHPAKYGIPSHIAKAITGFERLEPSTLFSEKYSEFMLKYVEKKEILSA